MNNLIFPQIFPAPSRNSIPYYSILETAINNGNNNNIKWHVFFSKKKTCRRRRRRCRYGRSIENARNIRLNYYCILFLLVNECEFFRAERHSVSRAFSHFEKKNASQIYTQCLTHTQHMQN